MNRYVIEGLIRDIQAGKKVAIAAANRRDARHVFERIRDSGVEWDNVKSSNGSEYLCVGDGSLRVITANGIAPRGFVLDVAVLLDGLRPLDGTERRERFLEAIRPTGATRSAGLELVFCE